MLSIDCICHYLVWNWYKYGHCHYESYSWQVDNTIHLWTLIWTEVSELPRVLFCPHFSSFWNNFTCFLPLILKLSLTYLIPSIKSYFTVHLKSKCHQLRAFLSSWHQISKLICICSGVLLLRWVTMDEMSSSCQEPITLCVPWILITNDVSEKLHELL